MAETGNNIMSDTTPPSPSERVGESLIFLIGMPGAGKSYWAEHIAEAYEYNLVDMDDEIEDDEDMSITDIFDKYGEDWFRAKEKEILEEIINASGDSLVNTQLNELPTANSKLPTIVVACGGGTPCFFNNMARMKENGIVVYLRAKPETIIERIIGELGKRPLMSEQKELLEYADELLNERKAVYEQAHYIFDVENLTVTDFEKII